MSDKKKNIIIISSIIGGVLLIALGVLVFMLTYLVPQFTSLFESNGATLPALTQFIIGVSDFIKEKWYLILIIGFCLIFGIYELYFCAIFSISSTPQIFPYTWTGTIALVFSVIKSSILETSIVKSVSWPTAEITGISES